VATGEKMDRIDVVYLGQRQLKDNKAGDAFVPLPTYDASVVGGNYGELDHLSSLFGTSKDRGPPLIVGGVYTMGVKLDPTTQRITTAGVSGREWKHRHANNDATAHFEALDKTNRAHIKAERQLKKIKGESPLEREILKLRERWHALPWSDRTAFELTILSLIRKHGKDL
jgi:hypothetical protein